MSDADKLDEIREVARLSAELGDHDAADHMDSIRAILNRPAAAPAESREAKHSHDRDCCWDCYHGPDAHPKEAHDPSCEHYGCAPAEPRDKLTWNAPAIQVPPPRPRGFDPEIVAASWTPDGLATLEYLALIKNQLIPIPKLHDLDDVVRELGITEEDES